MDRDRFQQSARDLGLELSEAQVDAFSTFEEALYEANEVMNLTRVPSEEGWLRHFIDSLILARLIPEGATLLDIGTGPGFPAWPLACARPDIMVTALDSSGKMLRFLASQPLPNLTLVPGRAEEWRVREAFDVITGRALAPLPLQLELSAAPCRVGGVVLPMRTLAERDGFSNPAFETLGLWLEKVEEIALPNTEIVRAIPIYRKTTRTPAKYPRRWAEMRKLPLGDR